MPALSSQERVELASVRAAEKRFGAVVAVNAASCTFSSGEIHAVCGENGAGKSTLLKLVAGMLVADEGDVIVGGTRLLPHTPREAIRRGVAMVLQHFALIDELTVLENIVLGAEPVQAFGVLDRDAARRKIRKVAGELCATLPLEEKVGTLGIGDRQRIEIARALYRDARLVILDEPTAVLTKLEARVLYGTLRQLAESGKGIVVVTHKLDEVRAYADVVTVMRRGELVFTKPLDRAGDIERQVEQVSAAIMGAESMRSMPPRLSQRAVITEEPVLVLDGVDVADGLRNVSFSVRAGEIVGIAGVEGNGQKELVALLSGEMSPSRGSVVGAKAAVIHEDRQVEGLVLDASLRDNLVLGELARFTGWAGLLDVRALDAEATVRLERSGAVRSTAEASNVALDRAARTLSGGNQQKVVVARALARKARLIVAAQPTRGVDLGAARAIYTELIEASKRGAGVLVISADLDELRALASRILVLARGRIRAELAPTASDDEFGRAMLGLGEQGP